MIATWMLYATLVALCMAAAAALLERAATAAGRPVRHVWAAALLVSCALAAVALAPTRRLPTALAPVPSVTLAPPVTVAPSAPAEPSTPVFTPAPAPGFSLATLDRPLLLLWAAGSTLLLVTIGSAWAGLRRRRRAWRVERVDDDAVLVAPDVGPAVVGVARPSVVLPEWALALERPLRDLMLAHEQEHVRAGDARLLAAALLAVVLMPWNAALWWQLRRLRLAVEIDCDARVLRRHPDVGRYGALLVEVGRRAARGPAASIAFSRPTTFLERRIRAMTTERTRRYAGRAAAFALAAAASVAIAYAAPRPVSPLQAIAGVEPSGRRVPLSTNQRAFVQLRFELDSSERTASSLRMHYRQGIRFIEQVALDDDVVVDLGHIDSAWAVRSPDADDYDVAVRLNAGGRARLRAETAKHVGERMGIVVDGFLVAIPRIESPLGSTLALQTDMRLLDARSLADRINRIIAQEGEVAVGSRRVFDMQIVPNLPRLVGDSVMVDVIEGKSTAVAAATDLPDVFLVGSSTGVVASLGGPQLCPRLLVDPRDGTRLLLGRSVTEATSTDHSRTEHGTAEYLVSPAGRYGVAAGQRLRVGCGSSARVEGAPVAWESTTPEIRALIESIETETGLTLVGIGMSADRMRLRFAEPGLDSLTMPVMRAMGDAIARRAWSHVRATGIDTISVTFKGRGSPTRDVGAGRERTLHFYRAQLEGTEPPHIERTQSPDRAQAPQPQRLTLVGMDGASPKWDVENGAIGCGPLRAPAGVTLVVSRADAARAVRIAIRVDGGASDSTFRATLEQPGGGWRCSVGTVPGAGFYGREAIDDRSVLTFEQLSRPLTVTAITADGTVIAGPVTVTRGATDLAIAWDGTRR